MLSGYIREHGLASEADYPYTGVAGTCRADSTPRSLAAGAVRDYVVVPANDEAALKAAVAAAPVSVAIEADEASFQFYSAGVLTAACGHNLDHGVLAVGYGTDAATGTDFWTVKNSWGAGWGDRGFIRLQRGINQCGIALAASYPVM